MNPTATKPKPKLNTVVFALEELHPHPNNARVHDMPRIRQTLGLGQYKPITVNKGTKTGRPNEILAGHGVWEGAGDLGWKHIEGTLVDVDEEHALRILYADNRSGEGSTNDPRILLEGLSLLPDLDFTGYDPGDMDEIHAQLEEVSIPDDDGGEGPDWKPKGIVVSYQIVFDNEDQLARWNAFTKRLKALRDEDTIAGRLTGHVTEFLKVNGGV